MRRKMGAMDAPAPASPMDEGGDMGEQPAEAPADNSPTPTAFLPKEMGGGKQWNPGDEIVLKINSVDPETGEMQVSYAPEEPDNNTQDESTDSMSAMDKAMPDDGNGGGY